MNTLLVIIFFCIALYDTSYGQKPTGKKSKATIVTKTVDNKQNPLQDTAFLTNINQNELTLKIKIDNPVVYKKKDLSIKLELKNLTNNQIFIHKHPQFGYMSFCYDDFCFTVEKKAQNHYNKMEALTNIDRFGAYDSLGVSWNDIYDTLAVGDNYIDEFNIIGYYHLQKGNYRTRFNFNIPKNNNLPVKMIYSNWIYFEVKSNRVEYHY